MKLIEPCCAARHLMQLRDDIGTNGTTQFEGYGDLSLTELLPAILTRYSETELMIVAPSLPDQAADVIRKWMLQQWSRKDGNGKLDAVKHLTIISDLSKKKSPVVSSWLKDNPFGERLTLISRRQSNTAILLPDFAITGPVNMRYGEHFTATATTEAEKVSALWDQYTAEAGEQAEAPGDESLGKPLADDVSPVTELTAAEPTAEPAADATGPTAPDNDLPAEH